MTINDEFVFTSNKCDRCRDPSSWEHVSHTSWWHVACIIIRITLIRISLRIHVARFSYPDYLKEGHTTLVNITSGRLPQMHPDDQHRPSGYDWLLTEISKSYTLSQQPAMAHVPPPAEWKDKMKWQQVTSHDHLPRSLTAASPTTISVSRP